MSISLLINVILLIATLVIFADKSTHSIFNLVIVIVFSCILLYFFGLEYLSFIFLLLYVGAIIVLFLFVSMLLQIQLEYKITYFETPKMNYILIFSILIELGANVININPHLITMMHKLSFEYKQKTLGFVEY
jgi:NADH:ubiquinone oxidoreductase subunit 6 (subunit J)